MTLTIPLTLSSESSSLKSLYCPIRTTRKLVCPWARARTILYILAISACRWRQTGQARKGRRVLSYLKLSTRICNLEIECREWKLPRITIVQCANLTQRHLNSQSLYPKACPTSTRKLPNPSLFCLETTPSATRTPPSCLSTTTST